MMKLREMTPPQRRFVLWHFLLFLLVVIIPCAIYWIVIINQDVGGVLRWLPLGYLCVAWPCLLAYAIHQFRKHEGLLSQGAEFSASPTKQHRILAIKEVIYFTLWLMPCTIGAVMLTMSLVVLIKQVANGSVDVGIAVFVVSLTAALAACSAVYIFAKRRLGREWKRLA
ncbi:MAG: hypothetical protein OXG08_10885 [Gammaproteobacteria bacterium]|nr:hypothetical protein [Gammaproteobacteria bacterium]